MRTWISRVAAALSLLLAAGPAAAEVIDRLPTTDKVVALTFDACESRTPAFLDHGIADFLVSRKIPFTIFVSGRFARHNQADLERLARLEFVDIENHSMNHNNHMDEMDEASVAREVEDADTVLFGITGRHTHLFRFPAGNYSPRSLAVVEGLGYKAVQWSFASGDPVKSLDAPTLTRWVLTKTRPGGILIFHINGRGWATARALPGIVDSLTRKGYRFTTLTAALP